jgi:hypothetical protein
MSSIFLSHSHADKPFVRKLANDLMAIGHKVWIDEAEINIGDSLLTKITSGIGKVEYVAAIISSHSIESSWVQQELEIAYTRQINERRMVVLPILIEAVKLPDYLAGKYYGDFVNKRQYKKSFKILLRSFEIPHYTTLQERLLLSGVETHSDFKKKGALDKLEAKFAIADVIVDAEFTNFNGVEEKDLILLPANKNYPQLPKYVYEARNEIPRPQLNKTKAYLENWFGPIIDKGNKSTLHIGRLDSKTQDGVYDYWTTLAVKKSVPRLQKDLLNGNLRLRDLARRMDLVLVVVTKDLKLVLARRSDNVDNEQGHWMASIGESLDPSTDLIDGVTNPFEATRRCLHEYDELNLSMTDVANASLTALGIATEWGYLYANLIVLVELEIGFEKVKERMTDGEHTHLEGVNFNIQTCLPLVKQGFYEAKSKGLSAPIVPLSRVALLMSLMSRFKYDNVIKEI